MIYINKIRHWLFVLFYILILFTIGSNILGPLLVLKLMGVSSSTKVIDFVIRYLQKYNNYLTLRILGTKVMMYFDSKLPKKFKLGGPFLLESNHVGDLDPIYIGILYNRYIPNNIHTVSFAKETLRYYPIINIIMLANNVILVQNKNKKSNKSQHKYIQGKLEDYGNRKLVLIFPEGTTYQKNIKEYRESKADERNTPIYNNLMVPKTNGLYLTRKYGNIYDEYLLGLKVVNRNDGQADLLNLTNGSTPKEVHILINKVDKAYDETLLEPENRYLFNKYVYHNFTELDEKLNEGIEKWKVKYENIYVKPHWDEFLTFVLMTTFMGFSILKLLRYKYYIYYLLIINGFSYIMGFLELMNIKYVRRH